MVITKTAATVDAESIAREIWRLRDRDIPPTEIAKTMGIPHKVVYDALNGRRLAFPTSDRTACPKRRCPYCGHTVLSLPCLACEIDGTADRSFRPKPKLREPQFTLRDTPAMKQKMAVGRPPSPQCLDAAAMDRIRSRLICSDCGSRRQQYASGLVCPQGHGKIHPPVDPLDVRSFDFTERLATLPIAKPVAGYKYVVTVENRPGYFKRVSGAEAKELGNSIDVACRNRIWHVVPHSSRRFK
ncbi:MAG: hypothetical protein CMK32_09800 [Porticoccaceae bacterium]|nr:hypothetical protein [Porticoccaceae bacterium]